MRITPTSRASWRAWLEENHATKAEVWLVFYKRHTGKPSPSYNDAVEEALCFGWIDGIKRSIDRQRYMHRFTPRKPQSPWSELNKKRAARMRKAGLMTAAGLAAVRQAKRVGTWDAQPATADVSIPEELAAALRRDKRAAAFFTGLAPSYRRQFTGWINAAKRPATRARRVSEALELLRRGEKLGMR